MAEARIPGIGSGQETKEEKKKAKKILWSQYATTRSSATESQPTAVRLVSNGNLRTEHHFGVFDLVTPSVEFVELKATVVLSTKEFLHKFTLLPAPTEDSHCNEKDEEWSSNVHLSLQLISVEADPSKFLRPEIASTNCNMFAISGSKCREKYCMISYLLAASSIKSLSSSTHEHAAGRLTLLITRQSSKI